MENELQVTQNEIVKLNRGNWEDSNEIIARYIDTKDLIIIRNQSFNGYLSYTLNKKDLRLKTTFRYLLDQIKDADTSISVLVKWGGWILLIGSQLLRINLLELIKQISVN